MAAAEGVDFIKDVHPILQSRCVGCHNAREANGGLDLTDIEKMAIGGKSGPMLIQGKPDDSLLYIYVAGDPPVMPMGAAPLQKEQVEVLRRWILEGAVMTPAPNEEEKKSPAAYYSPPVISALMYSPDGSLLAVSGYREILVWKSDGSDSLARLPGRSDRINALAFSPDGSLLAAVGGSPSQFGEIQFWSVKQYMPLRAIKMTLDTLHGVSFSPDGKKAAFGDSDKNVHIVNVPFGKELVEFENHSDWVLSTTFSTDGKHLISGGRDHALKLIEVETGSFIDDINSSNKGYGMIFSLDRHPTRDEVVEGGDDGVPRLYKIYRTHKRDVDNTDFNLLRAYPKMAGGVNVVRFSPYGALLAAGGVMGLVRLYNTESGTYKVLLRGDAVSVFSLAFHPNEPLVAVGGFEGHVRIFNIHTGELVRDFVPVPLEANLAQAVKKD